MAFEFACPSCQSPLRAPEKLIGTPLCCPRCSVMIEVPAPMPVAAGAVGGRDDGNRQALASPEAPPADFEEEEEDDDEDLDRSFKGKPSGADTEMDMTPMVDVTFLLLIFFMITSAFSLQKALPTPTPKSEEASVNPVEQEPEEDPDMVIVKVDANNTYTVIAEDWEEEAPSKHDLIAKLKEARSGGSSGVIPTALMVRANAEARHDAVVAALDAGQAAGLEKVKLQTVEGDDDE